MTTTLIPYGNTSIIDSSLRCLSIRALLTIRPLQNQRVVQGHMGTAAVSGDGMTLQQHQGGSPTTGDGAVIEKVLHNARQVQAHI